MIAQENGAFEDILEHFTLQPGDFTPSLHLSDLILQFHIELCSGCEISLLYPNMVRKLR